jgi:Arc/MetJ-type ribon-helix-helix transcriptional regulator
MKTEKVSVNLNPVELGLIDCLVERGLFDNRSDFMRSAARKHLDGYKGEIQQFLEPEHLKEKNSGLSFTIGIAALTKDVINAHIAKGKKIHIRAIGLYTITNSITPEEIKQAVLSCIVHGKLIAGREVKEALREINEGEGYSM